MREAREVEPGDIFVIGAVRVQSVMTEAGSTYISWRGDVRPVDVVGEHEEAPDVIPHKCPECGRQIVSEEWMPYE